jgi:hypothetical protein
MPRNLLWPDPRVKPPYGAAEIDPGHPLAKGLVFCFLFNEGGGVPHSLVGALDVQPAAGLTWASRSSGLGIRSVAASPTGLYIPTGIPSTFSSSWTWDTLITPTSSGDDYGSLLTRDAVEGFWFRHALGLLDYFGQDGEVISSTAVTLGTTHHYAGRCLGPAPANTTIYLDGKADGTAASGTIRPGFPVNRMLDDPNSNTFDGLCYFQRFWMPALSAGAIQWLAKEPYCFLRPIVRRRWSFPATTATVVPQAAMHYRRMRA